MSTKVLNLDTFGGDVKRTITIFGKEHVVEEMTVENFIETTRTAQRLEKEQAGSPEQIEATVEMIKRSIPTIDVDQLRKVPLVKLAVIVKFIRGDMDDQVADAAASAEKAGDEAAKK